VLETHPEDVRPLIRMISPTFEVYMRKYRNKKQKKKPVQDVSPRRIS